jgi:hypothetical protein
MDPGESSEGENGFAETQTRPRQLPDDLPTSLDDRRHTPHMGPETEMYDAWQGRSFRSHLRLDKSCLSSTDLMLSRTITIPDLTGGSQASCIRSRSRQTQL